MKQFVLTFFLLSLSFAGVTVESELFSATSNTLTYNTYIKTGAESASGLVLKYYLDESEQSAEIVPVIDWSPINPISISREEEPNGLIAVVIDMSSAHLSANSSHLIQLRMYPSDWGYMDHSNDPSFADLNNTRQPHTTVSLYQEGQLVFGQEPSLSNSSSQTGSSSSHVHLDPEVIVRSRQVSLLSNGFNFEIEVENTGDVEIDGYSFKYFLNWSDHIGHLNPIVDWTNINDLQVASTETSDYLGTIQFSTQEKLAPGDKKLVQVRFNLDDNTDFDVTNDFSYEHMGSQLAENSHISLSSGGERIYGYEPNLPILPLERRDVQVDFEIIDESSAHLILKALVSNVGNVPVQNVAFKYYSNLTTQLDAVQDYSSSPTTSTRISQYPSGQLVIVDFEEEIFAVGEVHEVHLRIFKTDNSLYDYTQDPSYLVISNNELYQEVYIAGHQVGETQLEVDSDGDGVPDVVETQVGTDAQDAQDYPQDSRGNLNWVRSDVTYIDDPQEDLIVVYDYTGVSKYGQSNSKVEVVVKYPAGTFTEPQPLPPVLLDCTEGSSCGTTPSAPLELRDGYFPLTELQRNNLTSGPVTIPYPDYTAHGIPNRGLSVLYQGDGQTHWTTLNYLSEYSINKNCSQVDELGVSLSVEECPPEYLTAEINIPASANRGVGYYYLGIEYEYQPIATSGDFLIVEIEGQLLSKGNNSSGQLGIGSTSDTRVEYFQKVHTPQDFDQIVQVDVGQSHVLALDKSGQVWCWGDNSKGQCGQPNTAQAISYPTQVQLPTSSNLKVLQVAAGRDFSAVVLSDGSLVMFGDNSHGQLGINSLEPYVSTPTQLSYFGGLGDQARVDKISLGDQHVVVMPRPRLIQNFETYVWAWGDNSQGNAGFLFSNSAQYGSNSSPTQTNLPYERLFLSWEIQAPWSSEATERLQPKLVDVYSSNNHSIYSFEYSTPGHALIQDAILVGSGGDLSSISSQFDELDTWSEYQSNGEIFKTTQVKDFSFAFGNGFLIRHGIRFAPQPAWSTQVYGANTHQQILSGSESLGSGQAYRFTPAWTINDPTTGHSNYAGQRAYLSAGTNTSAVLYEGVVYEYGQYASQVNQEDESLILYLDQPVGYTTSARRVISGQSKGIASISVSVNGEASQVVYPQLDGSWSLVPSNDYQVGINDITVLGVDEDGVEVQISGMVNYQLTEPSELTMNVTPGTYEMTNLPLLEWMMPVEGDVSINLHRLITLDDYSINYESIGGGIQLGTISEGSAQYQLLSSDIPLGQDGVYAYTYDYYIKGYVDEFLQPIIVQGELISPNLVSESIVESRVNLTKYHRYSVNHGCLDGEMIQIFSETTKSGSTTPGQIERFLEQDVMSCGVNSEHFIRNLDDDGFHFQDISKSSSIIVNRYQQPENTFEITTPTTWVEPSRKTWNPYMNEVIVIPLESGDVMCEMRAHLESLSCDNIVQFRLSTQQIELSHHNKSWIFVIR